MDQKAGIRERKIKQVADYLTTLLLPLPDGDDMVDESDFLTDDPRAWLGRY